MPPVDPAAALRRLLLYLNDCAPGCGCENDRFFLQAARVEGWLADDGREAGLAAAALLASGAVEGAIGGGVAAADAPRFLAQVRVLLASTLATWPVEPGDVALATDAPCGDGREPEEPLRGRPIRRS